MQIFGKLRIVAPFKSEFKLTLGYLNPALNNPTLSMKIANLPDIQLSTCFPFILFFLFYQPVQIQPPHPQNYKHLTSVTLLFCCFPISVVAMAFSCMV